MTEDELTLAPPEQEVELKALGRATHFAEGFALLFACCNSIPLRTKLIQEFRSQNPDLNVLEVSVTEPVDNLLDVLRDRLQEQAPDAVFVFGFELWMDSTESAEHSALVANLNATRDALPDAVPCPLVLWLPEYILVAIQRAAPDLFSVHSGLYTFVDPDILKLSLAASTVTSDYEESLAALPYEEKLSRIGALQDVLAAYGELPPDERELLVEVRLLDSLGRLLHAVGRSEDAEAVLRRVLDIRQVVQKPDAPAVIAAQINLGTILIGQGRYAEAKQLYERALQLAETRSGPESVDAAIVLTSLAGMYDLQHDYQAGELAYRRAISIIEKLDDHKANLWTAYALDNLAGILRKLGKLDEAEAACRRAISLYEHILPSTHPRLASSLAGLAGAAYARGDVAGAEELYVKSLENLQRALGPTHPTVAATLGDFGGLRFAQGRYIDARELIERAIEIQKSSLGPDHPHLATSYDNYAEVLSAMGELDQAKLMRDRADAIRAKHVARESETGQPSSL
jgi:tetratricopeptide (TPR) repeat protein